MLYVCVPGGSTTNTAIIQGQRCVVSENYDEILFTDPTHYMHTLLTNTRRLHIGGQSMVVVIGQTKFSRAPFKVFKRHIFHFFLETWLELGGEKGAISGSNPGWSEQSPRRDSRVPQPLATSQRHHIKVQRRNWKGRTRFRWATACWRMIKCY